MKKYNVSCGLHSATCIADDARNAAIASVEFIDSENPNCDLDNPNFLGTDFVVTPAGVPSTVDNTVLFDTNSILEDAGWVFDD